MKILMILSNPSIFDSRVYKEAEALIESGFEVTIIEWDRKNQYEPQGFFKNIRLIRIHNTGIMKIVKSDLFRNPIWWHRAYKKGLKIYKEGYKFDIVHCHDLDTLYAGFWLKKKLGIKLIYDAHELWGYLIEKNVPNFVVKITFLMEKRLVKKTDHIITVSDPFLKYFKSISSIPISIVMNCKDMIYKEYEPPESNIFTLIYIGGMKKRRFFPEIIDIIGNLDNTKLILAGKTEDLFNQIREYSIKYSNIEFKGTIPNDDILKLTRHSNATFIIIDPESTHYKNTLYNKQFEAMVCGRPIIVTNNTHASEITEKIKCGVGVDYNEESVQNTIIKLRDNPKLCEELGKNAFKAAKEKYNWAYEKEKLLKIYKEII